MSNDMNIQWFPGHMTKTNRMIEKDIKLVDMVVEVIDARIPQASRNPQLKNIIGNKPKMLLMNKADNADDRITEQWLEYYKEKGIVAIPTDCRTGKGLKKFPQAVREALADKIKQWEQNNVANSRPIRIMIVGIPNVGKSSLINRLSGSKRAKVEDRPGVTRGKQWVTLENGIELLDMPGVLWPKFENKRYAEHLAFTGAIKDDVLDIEYLAVKLVELMQRLYPEKLIERYKLTEEEVNNLDGFDLMEVIARRRGMLMSGGHVNTERCAIMLLDEFRGGKLGNLTLERPQKKVAEEEA